MKTLFVKGQMGKIFRDTQGGLTLLSCSCLKASSGVSASRPRPVAVKREMRACVQTGLSPPEYLQVSVCRCVWRRAVVRITESQNARGWKGPLWVTQSSPPAEAGSPTAGCTGPCPGGAWISPEKETPQPPWVACSSAPSPSEGRSSSSCSDGTS